MNYNEDHSDALHFIKDYFSQKINLIIFFMINLVIETVGDLQINRRLLLTP